MSYMKVMCDKNKNLSVNEYLNEIKPYLKDIITDFQKSGTGKFNVQLQLTFFPLKIWMKSK